MGRELRRVPLDFDWPIRQVWGGYVMPDDLRLPPCPDCDTGATAAFAWVETFANRLAMLAQDIGKQPGGQPMHPWLADDPHPPHDANRPPIKREGPWVWYETRRPTPDIVELVAGLSGESPEHLTSSWATSSTSWRITKAIVAAAGLPENWGWCPTCKGETHTGTPEQVEASEAWERSGPPSGPGYQLWETVSEGSPISPVFADDEGLIEWMTRNQCVVGDTPPSRAAAEAFVRGPGWAPSFVMTPEAGLVDGVTATLGRDRA